YRRDPTKIVAFATSATPAQYAEFAPLVFEYATRGDPLAVELVQETAEAATRIIDRLIAGGATAVSLIRGLADPVMPWLPSRVRGSVRAFSPPPQKGHLGTGAPPGPATTSRAGENPSKRGAALRPDRSPD